MNRQFRVRLRLRVSEMTNVVASSAVTQPGAADQDVRKAVLACEGQDCGLGSFLIPEVEGNRRRSRNARCGLTHALSAAVYPDDGARIRQSARDFETNPSSRPGDERHLVVESEQARLRAPVVVQFAAPLLRRQLLRGHVVSGAF